MFTICSPGRPGDGQNERKKSVSSNDESKIYVTNQRQFAREIGKEARRQNGVVRSIFLARANPDYNGRRDCAFAIISVNCALSSSDEATLKYGVPALRWIRPSFRPSVHLFLA